MKYEYNDHKYDANNSSKNSSSGAADWVSSHGYTGSGGSSGGGPGGRAASSIDTWQEPEPRRTAGSTASPLSPGYDSWPALVASPMSPSMPPVSQSSVDSLSKSLRIAKNDTKNVEKEFAECLCL